MSLKSNSGVLQHKTKGAQTKHQILLSAISVLAQNGIKGTTHRAIAQHANIQLSLTTYYFKDINELIHQAFELNSQQVTSEAGSAWKQAFEYIESFSKQDRRKIAIKKLICQKLVEISTKYLSDRIVQQPKELAVEQLLFTEIQTTPALREMAKQHKSEIMQPFIKLCRYFNPNTPEVDADILATMYTQLEYRNLSAEFESEQVEEIKAISGKLMTWVLGLKN